MRWKTALFHIGTPTARVDSVNALASANPPAVRMAAPVNEGGPSVKPGAAASESQNGFNGLLLLLLGPGQSVPDRNTLPNGNIQAGNLPDDPLPDDATVTPGGKQPSSGLPRSGKWKGGSGGRLVDDSTAPSGRVIGFLTEAPVSIAFSRLLPSIPQTNTPSSNPGQDVTGPSHRPVGGTLHPPVGSEGEEQTKPGPDVRSADRSTLVDSTFLASFWVPSPEVSPTSASERAAAPALSAVGTKGRSPGDLEPAVPQAGPQRPPESNHRMAFAAELTEVRSGSTPSSNAPNSAKPEPLPAVKDQPTETPRAPDSTPPQPGSGAPAIETATLENHPEGNSPAVLFPPNDSAYNAASAPGPAGMAAMAAAGYENSPQGGAEGDRQPGDDGSRSPAAPGEFPKRLVKEDAKLASAGAETAQSGTAGHNAAMTQAALPDGSSGPGDRQPQNPRHTSSAPTTPSSEPDPPPGQRSTREISLRIPGTDSQPVDLRVTERGGKVQVSVRTPDSNLAEAMRSNLGDLVGRLEQRGFATEAWFPPRAGESSPHPTSPDRSQSFGQPGDRSGSERGRGDRQQSRERNKQRKQNLPVENFRFNA